MVIYTDIMRSFILFSLFFIESKAQVCGYGFWHFYKGITDLRIRWMISSVNSTLENRISKANGHQAMVWSKHQVIQDWFQLNEWHSFNSLGELKQFTRTYKSNYPDNTNCNWFFGEEGSEVEITFTAFAVENHATCNYDAGFVYCKLWSRVCKSETIISPKFQVMW